MKSERSGESAPNTELELLWPASLGILGLIIGWPLVPAIIHMMGRGGRQETVEWALYMSLLIAYPPIVWLVARGRARISDIRLVIVALSLLAGVVYLVRQPSRFVGLLLALSAAVATVAAFRKTEAAHEHRARRLAAQVIAATFGWYCVGGLVSWTNASHWLLLRPQGVVVLLLAGACTCLAIAGKSIDEARDSLSPIDWAAIAILTLFSFRTFPIIEFYHWGFYIGPIEQLREGGRILWDTPSQYGLVSILLPAIIPGSSWESFWLFQSVIFAITGAMMYVAFRRLGNGWISAIFSFLLVFTTLFFRPRTDSLLLAAQMTPSGGPVRFIPMFALLAFLYREICGRQEKQENEKFVVYGSLIWFFALLWSAEAAIYCSAIWFSALAVYMVQRAIAWSDSGKQAAEIGRRLLTFALAPVIAAGAAFALVSVVYRFIVGGSPDFHGYIEYALLYSRGGFGALPIDPTGSVWFLLLVFFAISTAVATYLSSEPQNRRLVMIAGIWGGVWSVGSYFTGRSHPVNVLSLAPVVLYSAALMLATLASDTNASWYRVIRAALIPAFVLPIVLTLAHSRVLDEVARPQLAPSSIQSQIPPMDGSLRALLTSAGATPQDPVVLVGDGRLMLPPWASGDSTVMSRRSWLPKPYEIIGSLPEARRNVYIDRNAARFGGGWLVHSKTDTITGFGALHAQLLKGRTESRKSENDRWIVSWIGKPPP